ncbi:hypothetical protein SK128_016628 [Halocaridina rubra]|uniref:Uncharacterized protein n=1 Tax=Halocaridina rubra TaxID=373956 RepID=A0AAN8WRJ3_HALRR
MCLFKFMVFIACYQIGRALVTDSGLLKIKLSPNAKETSGKLIVPFKECGYVFCEAPDVEINDNKHYWDYYIDWEMPESAQKDSSVFVIANDFQMPRSYLIFRRFNSNFTGDYKCILQFREKAIASYAVTVTMSDVVSTRNCNSPNT